jgi:hypothetical protein
MQRRLLLCRDILASDILIIRTQRGYSKRGLLFHRARCQHFPSGRRHPPRVFCAASEGRFVQQHEVIVAGNDRFVTQFACFSGTKVQILTDTDAARGCVVRSISILKSYNSSGLILLY